MNYDKLVEALRWNGTEYKGSTMDEEDKKMYLDAAAAIEELLKENKELIEDHPEMVEADGHWEWRKPNGEVLLPKQGEIVRCGECKWWHEFFNRGVGQGRGVCAIHTDPLECNADWFCADGEREVQDDKTGV